MSKRSFEVTQYTIQLGDKLSATFEGTTIKARGIINCLGPDDQRVIGYFLSDDSPVPAATTTNGGKWGPVFLPTGMMLLWVDMLRNEKPIYAYINTDHPEWTNVSTGTEPVGEED